MENQETIPSSHPGLNQASPAKLRPQPFLRIIRRFFLGLLLTVILMLTAGIILIRVYEDEIKSYAIELINEKLNTPLFVDPKNIDVTFLGTFPNASVDFKSVSALGNLPGKSKDTLFTAKKIGLQFNIMNIFRSNYSIRKIQLEGMDLNLLVDKQGNDNYHIFKQESDTDTVTVSENFELKLEQIQMDDCRIRWTDKKNKQELISEIMNASVSGNFTSENYEMGIESEMMMRTFRSDTSEWIKDKVLKANLLMDIETKDDIYTFKDGQMTLGDLKFLVKGSMSGKSIALVIEGKDLNIQTLSSVLPAEQQKELSTYESDGDISFSASLLDDISDPLVHAFFEINDGTLRETSRSGKLENIKLSGTYQNKKAKEGRKGVETIQGVWIRNFSANIEGGHVSGTFSVTNFNNPVLEASLDGKMDLGELNKFLGIDTISAMEGTLTGNIKYRGPYRSNEKYTLSDFEKINTSGEVKITNGKLVLRNSTMEFSDLNGVFRLKNSDAEIESFKGKALSSDFELKGYFRDVVRYFLSDKEEMTVEASFHSDFLDLNEVLSNKNEETVSDTAYSVSFPKRMNLKLRSTVDKTVFRKFEAQDIKGELLLKDQKIVIDPVSFRTMDGGITSSVMIDGTRGDEILITCDADLKNINAAKLFAQMENFGQDYLTDRHLKGFITADIQFASVWGYDLSIQLDKVYARSNVTIERGELIGFEPFLEIAADLKKDLILRELIEVDEFKKKMERIKFTTMQNEIVIKNRTISIPQMEVKSSAMNITFDGKHTFSNEIEYNFSFLLSEVMTKGKKKRIEENKEFGVEEDDGTGMVLYYQMKGTVDKYDVKKNYTRKKQVKKEKREKEKENLKDILREELKWLKKDTTKKKDLPKNGTDKFIIRWDEDKEKEPENPGDEDF